MKPKLGREIALLTLPFLLIGGVAWWQTRVGRGNGDLLVGIEQGTPRVEWSGFQNVEVTPAEAARGLTVHLQTTLWNGGAMPDTQSYRRFRTYISSYQQPLHLVYRHKGKWKRYAAPDGTSGVRFRINRVEVAKDAPRPRRASWNTDVYLPLADLPQDAIDVQLKGQWQAQWWNEGKVWTPASLSKLGKWDGRNWELETRSRAFAVPLEGIKGLKARAGELPDVSREAAVTLVEAKSQSVAQGENDGYGQSEAGDGRIVIRVNAPVGRVRWKNNWPGVLEYRLYDAKGKEWTKPSGGLQQPEWRMGGSGGVGSGGSRPKGEFWLDGDFSLSHIPASAGVVRAKIWISDDSQGWPLVVEREVRPQWIYQRTPNLQIESMRVVKTPEDMTISDMSGGSRRAGEVRHRVEVVVRYLGNKRGVPRGYKQNHVMNPPIDFWEWAPMAPYRDGWSGGILMPITPRDADLIFHWSQRVLTARGTVFKTKISRWRWANPIGAPRPPQRLDAQGKRWAVRYDLNRLPPLKPNEKLRFRAQLGVAGEGFISAEMPLTRAMLR